jgi:fucose permease
MGLLVLGLQQSSQWGWGAVQTWACLVAGAGLAVAFVAYELRVEHPLLDLRIFRDRAFAADAAILAVMSIVFVPFFFFGSVYAQAALGESSSNAGLYIMYFFLGFVIAAQVGGRILDKRGARPAIVLGAAIGAVGFFLLAGKLTDLDLSHQRLYIAIAGAGLGLMLGPASTDAVNRAPSTSYSEVTGITQTGRNFGASLGLAVLGTIMIERSATTVTAALTRHGGPHAQAEQLASSFSSAGGGGSEGARAPAAVVHDVQLAFAQATQTVFYIMAGIMVATYIVAHIWLPKDRVSQEISADASAPPAPEA